MYKAIDIAKWFMEKNLDEPRNSLMGNMKLQKLLFFAQLIYIALYDDFLIKENFNAYEHGMIIEPIRLKYKNNYNSILEEGNTKNLDEKAFNALNLTAEIYGDANADELSTLSHQFDYWRKYFINSDNNGYKKKEKSVVPNEELKKEIDNIKDVITAYEIMKNNKDNLDLEVDY